MDRNRFVVGDAAWGKVAPLLPGKASDSGVTARDNRLFLEAVLWRGPPPPPPRGPPPGLRQGESGVSRLPPLGGGGGVCPLFPRAAGGAGLVYAPGGGRP